MKGAHEVPVVAEDAWFVAADEARVAAMHEAQSAPSDEARFEATALATNLYTQQISHLSSSLIDDLREAFENDPAHFDEAKAWIEAWNDEASRQLEPWADYQSELVEALGRDRAQEIADGPVSRRMQAILDAVKTELRRRLLALGADPDALDQASVSATDPDETADVSPTEPTTMKTCPDCAEEIKAAARKCRYCGYRFDQAIGE